MDYLKQRVMKTSEKEIYFTPLALVIAYGGEQMICASLKNVVILDPVSEENYDWEL